MTDSCQVHGDTVCSILNILEDDMKFCFSCGMPLDGEEAQKASGNHCQYCTDEKGNLKSKEDIAQGMVQFMTGWQPKVSEKEFLRRAYAYMSAMPSWADELAPEGLST